MLQLKNIKKSYTTGDFTQTALDGITLNFRKTEFVAILGTSGSGKTTCLNVVGGLDKYDSGDLIINGKSTKHFKDSDWDAYRNNSVGFIFQSYNLISHLSIVDNVEMGMTLSGVSSKEKHEKAIEVLERVGLKDHLHKKPNQLSGGQMQRVAIARALANDPDIILADEPTGALDTTTSAQIMDLIKEIADDKLVIMVTHNPDLAERYADRIVRFQDGKVIDDTNPYTSIKDDNDYKLKRTSMSYFTALKLSGKNIYTKKWRTLLTAFASSIGIIGIALILSLSAGFQIQIDQFQSDALAEFPVIVSKTGMDISDETMEEMRGEMMISTNSDEEQIQSDEVFLYDPNENNFTHENNISPEFIEYMENVDPEICNAIGYTRMVGMNLVRKVDDKIISVSFPAGMSTGSSSSSSMLGGMNGAGLASYPENLNTEDDSYLQKNYDLLSGSYPTQETDLVLVIDNKNRLDITTMQALGFDIDDKDSIAFDEIIGTEIQLVPNNDFYIETEMGNFMPIQDLNEIYDGKNNITLKITGILRQKADVSIGLLGNGIVYSDHLVQKVIDIAEDSDIVKAQKDADYNVMSMEKFEEGGKDSFITYLGGDSAPFIMYFYPKDFEAKDALLSYIEDYNKGKGEDDTIVYTDLADTMTSMTGSIMDAITIVLIAFASISLIVSLIMVAIITYISVIERTKEIGVLRALGARKKDITRVFNAETFIIGICSGALGIAISYLLTIPVNNILENLTGLANIAQLNPLTALALVAVSIILTLLGGFIPAKMAAKKDPVEALRSE